MNAALPPGARTETPHLGSAVRGGVWRLLLAACVLALAAAAITLSGASGVFGPLGSVLGLDSGRGETREGSRVAHRPAPVVAAASSPRRAAAHSVAPRRHAHRRHSHSVPPPHRRPTQAPAQPAPATPPPPAVPPSPGPAPGGGTVEWIVKTTSETVGPVAPPAQPVLDQTVATAGQVCSLIGGCP